MPSLRYEAMCFMFEATAGRLPVVSFDYQCMLVGGTYRLVHWLLRLQWCWMTAGSCVEEGSVTWNDRERLYGYPASTNHWRLRPDRSTLQPLTARNMCPSPGRLPNERRRIHSIRSAATSAVEFDPTAVSFSHPYSQLPSSCVPRVR